MRLRLEGLHWTRSGDQIVVLDLRRSEYLALNGSGGFLWEKLAEAERSSSELASLLVDRFEVSPRAAVHDVSAFLDTLISRQLIER